ncbi:MAG: hypothetical protein FJ011_21740 [Chloroflexi bacterium]|nr:hypothetical protein [Chloroflexota bacterium]
MEGERQVDLAEVLTAFANARGGHLLVGVSDMSPADVLERVLKVKTRPSCRFDSLTVVWCPTPTGCAQSTLSESMPR